jgi:hypothetical protein
VRERREEIREYEVYLRSEGERKEVRQIYTYE